MNWIPLVELPPAFFLKLSETQVCNSMFHFGHRTPIVKKQPSSQSWCISQCVYLYFATSKCICSPIVDLFDDPLNKPKLKYWPLDELIWTEPNWNPLFFTSVKQNWSGRSSTLIVWRRHWSKCNMNEEVGCHDSQWFSPHSTTVLWTSLWSCSSLYLPVILTQANLYQVRAWQTLLALY